MHGMRRPHTHREIRQAAMLAAPHFRKYSIRPRRTWKHVPNAWDDGFIVTERSWKKFRRTQWKSAPSRS